MMNRIKALCSASWGIPCGGTSVYAPRHRAQWLAQLVEPGVRVRAPAFYQQLDGLQPLRLEARRELLRESQKHPAVEDLLRQIPSIGPIRAALLVALLQTPHRFRTRRQLWAYSGFAVETHDSGEYRNVRGKLQRDPLITVRGLNDNHNQDLKNLFKGAALCASTRPGPLHDFYGPGWRRGMRPTMARRPYGTKDCCDHFNHLEERSKFRRQTIASASSLSVSGEGPFHLWRISPVVVGRVLETLGSRVSISQ